MPVQTAEGGKHYATGDFRSVKVNGDRIDFDLSTEHIEKLIESHPNFYQEINSFKFNIFEFSRTVGRNMQMPFIATSLLKHNNLLQVVDYHKFLAFIVQIYNNYGFKTEVLTASIRHTLHVLDAAKAGAHVGTMPFGVFEKLIRHPLTDKGVQQFLADYAKIPK